MRDVVGHYFCVDVDEAQHAAINAKGGERVTRVDDARQVFMIQPGGEDMGDCWRHIAVPIEATH